MHGDVSTNVVLAFLGGGFILQALNIQPTAKLTDFFWFLMLLALGITAVLVALL